jgi:hypothetical protein
MTAKNQNEDMHTTVVHLNGVWTEIGIWAGLIVAWLACAGVILLGAYLQSWGGIIVGAAAAALVGLICWIYRRGRFELHGDEFAVDLVQKNPTRLVYTHGWGWVFWVFRDTKPFVAKDSYTEVSFVTMTADNVPITGSAAAASKVSMFMAQRSNPGKGTARIYHILNGEQKRRMAIEKAAEWVMAGFLVGEIRSSFEDQDLMFEARLRLHNFKELVDGCGNPDDPVKVRGWFRNKQNREEVRKLLRIERRNRNFSDAEYECAEEFGEGCAFKDRVISKTWVQAQEEKAAIDARITAYEKAIALVDKAGSKNKVADAHVIMGGAEAFVVHETGGRDGDTSSPVEKVWALKEIKGHDGGKKGKKS